VGVVPLVLLWLRPSAQQGVVTMSPSVLGHNARLLWHECLPWAVGTKVYKPLHVMDYVPWHMPLGYSIAARAGVALLALALLASLVFVVRGPTDRALRHLFVIGAATLVLVLVSFLFSLMVMDHFSMRYLAAGVLVLPLLLAPLVERFGGWRAALLLAPYLFIAGTGGWFSHGDWTRRAVPVRTAAGRAEYERRVLQELQNRKVEAVVADYWAAYRLDFLWREALPVAPLHESQDRHRAYRDSLDHAHRVAYVFDRDRSFESEAQTAADFDAKATRKERLEVGSFALYVYDRP